MRSLNYVQRVSLDFTGTLFPHAICLGDADNDSVIKFLYFRLIYSQLMKQTNVTTRGVLKYALFLWINQLSWKRCILTLQTCVDSTVYNLYMSMRTSIIYVIYKLKQLVSHQEMYHDFFYYQLNALAISTEIIESIRGFWGKCDIYLQLIA